MSLSTDQRLNIIQSIVTNPGDFGLPTDKAVITPIVDAYQGYIDSIDDKPSDPEVSFWSWYYTSGYTTISTIHVRKGQDVIINGRMTRYEFEVQVKSTEFAAWAGKVIDAMIEDAIKADTTALSSQAHSAPIPNISEPKPAIETDELDIEWFSVSLINGKRSVKVHAGRWTKFGVNCWNDFPGGKYDTNQKSFYDNLPIGDTKRGGKVVIEMSNGKPTKVLSFKLN